MFCPAVAETPLQLGTPFKLRGLLFNGCQPSSAASITSNLLCQRLGLATKILLVFLRGLVDDHTEAQNTKIQLCREQRLHVLLSPQRCGHIFASA